MAETTPVEPSDDAIAGAMIKYGDNFVRTLGALYRRANADDQRTLTQAFPTYFATYRKVALNADAVR